MAATMHRDVICTFCWSLCEDLVVEVEENRITKVNYACKVGRNKILYSQAAHAPLKVDGREAASLNEAYDEASRILTEAKAPLIYGLSSTTTEANGVAVELAEILKGVIDNPSSY